jgi:hypothetical protein
MRVGAASYAALAESLEVPLMTFDPELRTVAATLLLWPLEISGYPAGAGGEQTDAPR